MREGSYVHANDPPDKFRPIRHRGSREWYEMEVHVTAATVKALRVFHKGKFYWIPRSQIVDETSFIKSNGSRGQRGLLCITEWFAMRVGL